MTTSQLISRHPAPPTSSLFPLSRLSTQSFIQVKYALDNLRTIYGKQRTPILPPPRALPKPLIHDTSVPDSGYASAEEEDEDVSPKPGSAFDIEALRADTFEREHAIRWLTGFTARADTWIALSDCDAEADARAGLVDEAAALLSVFAGEDEEEDLTRTFAFPTGAGTDPVHVELNDAPLLSEDHTSVGLQSWGSSILLAERMCMDPSAFGLRREEGSLPLRVLELGAGTGLLSIAASKLLPSARIIATDYHPNVLANLSANVATNFPSSHPSSAAMCKPPVQIMALDWQHPCYDGVLDAPFDIILAADVVYHPDHTQWIKMCVRRLLAQDGVFWLIIPVRPTGRHEGMSNTVTDVFPRAQKLESGKDLAIVGMETLSRHDGVGRADESAYILYKIGWA